MARERVYTKGFSVVCTEAQRTHLEAEANRRRVSNATIVRDALDARYGLNQRELVGEMSFDGPVYDDPPADDEAQRSGSGESPTGAAGAGVGSNL